MALPHSGTVRTAPPSSGYLLSKAPPRDLLTVRVQGLSSTTLPTVTHQALGETSACSPFACSPFRFGTWNQTPATSLALEPWGDQHSSAPECTMSCFGGLQAISLESFLKDKLVALAIKNEANCIYLWPIKLAFASKLLRH